MNENKTDLLEQFIRLEWLLHRYHQQNHHDHGPMGDPHRGQGRVLALLKLKPEISQKELSDILDMRSQSLGELLAKLERSGYITRTPSQADRRIMDIRLTDAGKEASGKTEQRMDTDSLFACLDEEEQANLGDYLARIISMLEQQYSGGDQGPDYRDRPTFGGRGFGRFGGGQPPFDGRDFDRGPGMRNPPPRFDGRDFGHGPEGYDRRPHFEDGGHIRRPDDGDKPEDPKQE